MAKSSTKPSKSAKTSKVVQKAESSSESSSSSSESSSSSSDSSSSESSSSDSSDSEAEEKPKKQTKKVAEKAAESSDSDSSSGSSSSDSDSDSDSDDSGFEKEAPKVVAQEAVKEEKKEDSSSSASSSDSSDSSSSSSDSDSDSDSSSDSDSESEETEKAEKSTKRKAEETEESSSATEEEPVSKKQKSEVVEEPATLFVGRLSWNVDDDWLKKEFETIGGVTSARVMIERATGKSRGYGYVDFESKSAAEKALKEMQGYEIDGRPINLDLSTTKPKTNPQNDRAKQYGDIPSQPSDTLFVGNLSFNAQRETLYEMFGQHGTVVSCRLPTHPDTQQPKGFGYVQFASIQEAQAAFTALNGEYIDGRACRLDFSAPRENNNAGGRGGRGDFGGRGGRGGRGDFGGRGGRGGFGGRERSSPAPRTGANNAEFKGTKKTFD